MRPKGQENCVKKEIQLGVASASSAVAFGVAIHLDKLALTKHHLGGRFRCFHQAFLRLANSRMATASTASAHVFINGRWSFGQHTKSPIWVEPKRYLSKVLLLHEKDIGPICILV